jgi:hypothetical protein
MPELAGDHGDDAGHADEKRDEASSCHCSRSVFLLEMVWDDCKLLCSMLLGE